MKSLTTWQMCALLAISVISNKLLMLPSIMYEYAGRDAIFVIIFKFLLAALFIGILMYALTKNPDKTLRELVSTIIGDVGYRVLAFLVFVVYFFKTFLLLFESELFLGSVMYQDYDKLLFLVPTMLVAGYIAYKGLQTVGRTCEALCGVIFIGLFLTFLLSISELDCSNILPLGIEDFSNYFEALNACFLWFGNYFLIFFCLGDVKMSKNLVGKVYTVFGISTIFVLAFFFVFYANFEYSSGLHKFAISDITQFTPEIASFTKVDWFTVIIWMMTNVLQCAIQIYIMQRTFIEAFGIRKTQVFSFIFLSLILLIYLFNPFNLSEFIEFVTVYVSPFVFFVGITLLILILIATIVLNRRKSKQGGNKKCLGN